MSHQAWEDMLPYYLVDGTLTAEQRQALEAHVASCESCQMVLDDWRKIQVVMRQRQQAASLLPLRQTRYAASNHRSRMEGQTTMTLVYPRKTMLPSLPLIAALFAVVMLGVLALSINRPNATILAPTQQEDLPSIFEWLEADGRFELMTAEIANHVGFRTMMDAEYITFFAIPDDEFEAVQQAYQEDQTLWDTVFLAHIINRPVSSDDLADHVGEYIVWEWERASFSARNGIVVEQDDDGLLLNDHVRMMDSDIPASNGVIHVVDGALIPNDLLLPPIDAFSNTVYDVLKSDTRFSSFVELVEETPTWFDAVDDPTWLNILDGEEPITIFVPTNDAFESALRDQYTKFEGQYYGEESIIALHVVQGLWSTDKLVERGVLRVFWDFDTRGHGHRLRAAKIGGEIVIDGVATVVEGNIIASNGIIHVIDTALGMDEGDE